MKKSLKFFLGIALLLTLLCGAASVQAEADWTVLMYLCGTNLESEYGEATKNLAEVAKTQPNASVNFVIETGGAKEWKSQESLGFQISDSMLQRYQFDENGYTLVDEQPSASMGNPDTLTEFIRWGAAAYPAKKYMLVLWDHGGGFSMLRDEIYDEEMQSYEVGEAMQAAGTQFEVFLVDACLMSNLETASAAAPSAHYMVASQEVSFGGPGYAFYEWMQYLYDAPYVDGARFGRYVCDTTQQTLNDSTLTWSVIDLTKIDQVKAAFADFVKEMAALLPDIQKYSAFVRSTIQAESYGSSYKYMVDLGDFANRAKNLGISNETIFRLIDAITDAVIYHVKGQSRLYSHGLSFFYHRVAYPRILDEYAKNCPVPEYLAFLDAIYPNWDYDTGSISYEELDPDQYRIQTKVSYIDNGSHIQLEVTDGQEAVSTVDYQLLRYSDAYKAYFSLGSNFDVDIDTETGICTDRWDGKWAGYNGAFFEMDLIEETDTYSLYNVPVILYAKVRDYNPDALITDDSISYLRIKHIHDKELLKDYLTPEENDGYNGYYQVLGIYNENYLDGIGLPYLQGAYMSIVREIYDDELKFISYIQSAPFEIRADLKVQDYSLASGRYAFMYLVRDIFGRTNYSDPATAEYVNGEVTFRSISKETRIPEKPVPLTSNRFFSLDNK